MGQAPYRDGVADFAAPSNGDTYGDKPVGGLDGHDAIGAAVPFTHAKAGYRAMYGFARPGRDQEGCETSRDQHRDHSTSR
jgi:hypothetical protein